MASADDERAGKQAGWWSRPMQLVLGAGAVAAAVTAIVSLWPDPDPQDEAHLVVLSVVRMPLSEYLTRAPALIPQPVSRSTANSAPRPGAVGAQLAAFVRTARPTGLTTLQQDQRSRLTVTTTASPTTSPTASASTSPTTSPTTRATTDATATGSATARLQGEPLLSMLTAGQQSLVSAGVRDGLTCAQDDCKPLILKNAVGLAATTTQVDSAGQPVAADVAADRVIGLLGNARASGHRGDTLGVLVTTNVQTIGLRGKDLALTWTVLQESGDTPLPKSWLGTTMGALVRSSTENDSTVAYLWVPLPRARGSYVVQVGLGLDGHPLTIAQSPPFG
ncbi:hypothetical protein ACPPVT_06815 [Angustibacter sp. McL0619]|uniref:hypothetical protein n=1 Tax=Angustibacter sp. McL0619 TaxID=3415676 RepID=UPI003CF69660